MSGLLKRFRIENHKGIGAAFEASPDGKSFRLEGANGAGKSSVLDGLDWIISDDGSEAGMRNGAEFRRGEMVFGEYLITRSQKRGGKPVRNTPAAQLKEVRAALTRKTFSMLSDAEQVDAVRRIAPGLDVSALDVKEKRAYDERTLVNRDAKMLRAQAEGVVVPAMPAEVGEERAVVDVVDVAEIAGRKAPMERVIAAHEKQREAFDRMINDARVAHHASAAADRRVAELKTQLQDAIAAQVKATTSSDLRAQEVADEEQVIAALIDPDPSTIDAEIAAARAQNAAARAATEAHNQSVRAAKQARATSLAATQQRQQLTAQAGAKEAESKKFTDMIEEIQRQREAAIAEATTALPLPLAIAAGTVCYEGVVTRDLNTAARIRLDVAMAAVAGIKLMPVRDASLLDEKSMAELSAFANERGMQLIPEIVKSGAPLSVVIEDDGDGW